MNKKQGWLERSFERAQENIKQRPEHLRPRRYRAVTPKPTVNERSKDSGDRKD
jgi:hypothetical protein